MKCYSAGPIEALEPVRASPETNDPPAHGRVRRLGELRVPIALSYRPRATLYELPDGRRFFLLRLREIDGPRRRCVSVATLKAYATRNRLATLSAEIDALVARALS